MANTTTYLEKQEANLLINQSIDNINAKFEKIKIALSSKLVPIDKKSYHFIAELLTKVEPRNDIERILNLLVTNIIYKSEIVSQSAGLASFIYFFNLYSSLNSAFQDKRQNEVKLVEDYQYKIENIIKIILDNNKIAKDSDVKNIINEICGYDTYLAEAVYQAVSLAGLEGKILVENGKGSNFVIEQKSGYSFKLNPFKYFFGNNTSELAWERNNCKVLLVDGLVEKISELDQILQQAFQTKQSLAIIALGFSEEVVATLKTNQDRGFLDVIPIRVNSDLESLNLVNDISVVCGKEAVSALKGELLTYQTWEGLPTVDKIRVTLKETLIENSSTRFAVSSHIKYLLEKRQQQSAIEDLENLVDGRLKGLVSDAAIIHLPDTTTIENDSYRVKIDNCLRAVKAVLNYGITDLDKIVNVLEVENDDDHLSVAIMDSLKRIAGYKKELPTLSVITTIKLAGPVALMVLCSEGVVIKN